MPRPQLWSSNWPTLSHGVSWKCRSLESSPSTMCGTRTDNSNCASPAASWCCDRERLRTWRSQPESNRLRKEGRMGSSDQNKIAIAREYFMRADQGRPDILELFHEDAEVYFPKFGFGFGRNSFLEMVKGFEGVLEYIRHDYDRLIFMPSADYLVVEGTSQGRMSGKSWAGGKTPGGRFC